MAGLTDEQANWLKSLVHMAGWKHVVQPAIAARARAALNALALDPSERVGPEANLTDATLRARISEDQWLLAVIQNEIAVYDANKRNEVEHLAAANGDSVGASP